MDLAKVESIVSENKRLGRGLVSTLQDIQSELNYLPEEALIRVAEGLELPLSQVYGVATFYTSFSLKPRGRHKVNVCLGTACHVRGAEQIMGKLERSLQVKVGETTPDMEFTLEKVNCVGACALGPVVVTDGKYFGDMSPPKVERMLKDCRKTGNGELG